MIQIKYKLYKKTIPYLNAIQQILYNRGIPANKQEAWLNAGKEYILPWTMLDYDKVKSAVYMLANAIRQHQKIALIVDCDCDGYTSSAIFMNYFYKYEPEWAIDNIQYYHHEGKEHGLNDLKKEIIESGDISLIISPDGASNDKEAQEQLNQNNINIIILDHHECTEDYSNIHTIVVNTQLPYENDIDKKYPNGSLTGAGVVFKFCQAYNDLIYKGQNSPDWLYDLCALGNCGDMASYKELEIRALMNVGLNQISNPFVKGMASANDFSIQKMNGINYYSVAFYIVPFINAITRSGSLEEKDMVFKGMLEQYAHVMVPCSKRGCKGQEWELWQEAVLVAQRVKRRQTKLQDETMAFLENKIQEEHLNDNAIILLLVEPGQVERNLAGLCANKIQAKYQKPCAILIRSKQKDDTEDYYRGSMRNYSLSPVDDLKSELEKTGEIEFCAGHANAAGLGIANSHIDKFIEKFNKQYENIDQTPVYWVDYIWNVNTCDPNKILDIGKCNLYGQEIPESKVCIKDIYLPSCKIDLMGLAKGNPTLKITLPNGVSIIKFKSSEEEYEEFCEEDKVLTIIAKCQINEWQGNISPQLIIDEFELRTEWIF